MKIRIFLLVLLLSVQVWGQEMQSPDGKLNVQLSKNVEGEFTYTVVWDGKAVLEPSQLGIKRKDSDFSKGLKLINTDKPVKVEEEYSSQNAKHSAMKYRAIKYVYHLENSQKQKLDLIFQLSNDGFAFRYFFPGTSTDKRYITEEYTSFNFASLCLMRRQAGSIVILLMRRGISVASRWVLHHL
jgi:hypothetical protein